MNPVRIKYQTENGEIHLVDEVFKNVTSADIKIKELWEKDDVIDVWLEV